MENMADALKMAAAFLSFLLALGISISSFSQARQTADILIRYSDREYVTQYAEDLRTTTRIVGRETIIPAIYRVFKEYYKIYFYDASGNPLELFTITQNGGSTISVNVIDSTDQRYTLGSNRQQENFIMALLYGRNADLTDEAGNTIPYDDFIRSLNTGNSRISLPTNGICGTILSSGNKFEEKFGVYYPSQAVAGAGGGTPTVDAQTTNELKMRVISYYLQ